MYHAKDSSNFEIFPSVKHYFQSICFFNYHAAHAYSNMLSAVSVSVRIKFPKLSNLAQHISAVMYNRVSCNV